MLESLLGFGDWTKEVGIQAVKCSLENLDLRISLADGSRIVLVTDGHRKCQFLDLILDISKVDPGNYVSLDSFNTLLYLGKPAL